jgi:hypothetical protein
VRHAGTFPKRVSPVADVLFEIGEGAHFEAPRRNKPR